jgi:hypothetical protein
MKKKLSFIAIIFLLISCNANELRTNPTTLNINGSVLTLDAYVWRDFQPPTDSNGDPMRSTVTLNLISGPEILNSIHLVRQYVIQENDVWAADLYDLSINSSSYSGTSSNGPKWGPDILVDIVLEFTYDGKTYKILVPDINIEKVE